MRNFACDWREAGYYEKCETECEWCKTWNREGDFELGLQEQLDKLPYEKHADDGQYNDGKKAGFEEGARWAWELSKEKLEDE